MAGWRRLTAYVLAVYGALGCSYSEPWEPGERERTQQKLNEWEVSARQSIEDGSPLENMADREKRGYSFGKAPSDIGVESDKIKTKLGKASIELIPISNKESVYDTLKLIESYGKGFLENRHIEIDGFSAGFRFEPNIGKRSRLIMKAETNPNALVEFKLEIIY